MTFYAPPKGRQRTAGMAAEDLTRVTPAWLRQMYAMGDADVGRASSNNTQAVASFIGQYYSRDDLEAFCALPPPLA